jgi:hypothetical protein
MPNTPEDELKYQEFWSRMGNNSTIVQRMPGWMKGSPVNKRTDNSTEVTDERMSAKAAPTTNRCSG